MGHGVIDLVSQEVVNCNRRYVVSTASCRVFKAFKCALDAAGSDEGSLAEALYEYAPFFITQASVGRLAMDAVGVAWRGEHEVRKADVQWLSDNMPSEDLTHILTAILGCNTLTRGQSENFTQPGRPASGRRKRMGSASNVPAASADSTPR